MALASPPRRNYSDFLSNTNNDWNTNDEDDDGVDEYGYDNNDGDDDFGLPSVSSSRRKSKRIPEQAPTDPGGGLTPWSITAGQDYLGSRRYSNSADIAIERPAPSYPTTKKSEGKILRPQYKEILRDPANSLHLIHHPPVPSDATQKEVDVHSHRINRINKFKKILQATSIPLPELRSASWNGIPEEVRAMTWQLLLGYLPTSSERRVSTLERKRKEYLDGIRQAFSRGGTPAAPGKARGLDEAVWHQISIDVPRTNPHLELYGYEATQRSLERILYLWAVRHPASGYVQGINDLVTPFWQVFLGSYITDADIESGMDPGQLPKAVLDAVEADSFWCLTKLLDGIQDNYIFAQPGIQRQVAALRDLTARIDSGLAKHLQSEGVEFIQFSFRWMNCLLMREISVRNTIRMWDTYMVCPPFALPPLSFQPPTNAPLGRRPRLLLLPPLRVRRLPGQMVRAPPDHGLPGDHDVPAVAAHQGVDREGHRAAAFRGVHLAEPVQGEPGASDGREGRGEGRGYDMMGGRRGGRTGIAEERAESIIERGMLGGACGADGRWDVCMA